MLFRDISFDIIICTSKEILHAHLQQIKFFAVFHVVSFLPMSQLQGPVPELRISSSKPYRNFKSPFLSLMIVNNEGNKLFLMCKSISSKGSVARQSQNQGALFTRVYPSPVLMKLDARKYIILSCLLIKLTDELFSHVSLIFTIILNEWLATNGQHAILNNFEKNYTLFTSFLIKGCP